MTISHEVKEIKDKAQTHTQTYTFRLRWTFCLMLQAFLTAGITMTTCIKMADLFPRDRRVSVQELRGHPWNMKPSHYHIKKNSQCQYNAGALFLAIINTDHIFCWETWLKSWHSGTVNTNMSCGDWFLPLKRSGSQLLQHTHSLSFLGTSGARMLDTMDVGIMMLCPCARGEPHHAQSAEGWGFESLVIMLAVVVSGVGGSLKFSSTTLVLRRKW